MAFDNTFWAFVALIIFLLIIFYLKVPGQIVAALDKRSDAIKDELERARALREEAQALLSEYQRKQREAEKEAEDIVAEARHEAERLTEESNVALEEMIDRRTRAAEAKIAQAESQAVAEVRSHATEVAIDAAARVLGKTVTGNTADKLIDDGIAEIATNLKGPAKAAAPAAESPKPAPSKAKPAAAKAKPATAAKPAASADTDTVDDLKRISGVGPVIEKKLNALGITRFAQVAAWTPADVESFDAQLNFKGRIDREDWIAQAKKLAGLD